MFMWCCACGCGVGGRPERTLACEEHPAQMSALDLFFSFLRALCTAPAAVCGLWRQSILWCQCAFRYGHAITSYRPLLFGLIL